MPRELTARMLKRKVERWGWYSRRLIIVVFEDGKMALVDPEAGTYSSVRAWNPSNRAAMLANARNPGGGRPLHEIIGMARVEKHG